jgi:hypothetical protein
MIRRRHDLLALCLFGAITILLLHEFCKGLTRLWNFQSTSTPSVHLVLAAVKDADLEWTSHLKVPNLQVIPYIANDPNAKYHPPANRGNEAMMYLTYFYEFYNKLPDISILTHGADWAWHIDGALEYRTAYAIEHLDLKEVLRRKYLNLRVSWNWGCPTWINTSVTVTSPEYCPDLKAEEPFMKEAFKQNFPKDNVPPILSQPCCSQFAVTKEAIRSVPREQYKLQMDWLRDAPFESEISGRIWEHFWQWSFLRKAVDCPAEHKALCRAYHICFESEEDWWSWKEHEASRRSLLERRATMLANSIQPGDKEMVKLERQIKDYADHLEPMRQKAIDRGKSVKQRMEIAGDL